ncbi:Integrase, site-specific recombinase [Fulvivirga imtechensis AK7]|uniref:Tyrosine recombinase XerC n=1 Tax=Fulvivirga imtechensis AK7 TaxID=1237149 RepID=L8JPI3_9BACT|nr:tyrosine-type recombinase/integrase [Fulvivirga imtechensis]ELR70735.1 Integrase, site-specific recombinase [Fulvivirga imtechensis AK7]
MRETFLKYLQYEKRYSQHTITSYDNDISQLEEFITTNFPESDLATASHAVLRNWIVSLVDSGLEPRSINRKIACLRSFYKFMLKREVIDKDPTLKIRILKTSKKLPQFVHEGDITRLLDQCEFSDDFSGARDRLIMELLYGTGIRLAELITLKTSDINFQNRTLKVLGKRNKERVIPFSLSLERVIDQYISAKNSQGFTNDGGVLLVTDNGDDCYPMIIYRTVKKYLNQFTTIEKRSPHVLRHTFATHLLNKGAELNAVKDLLGHTSLAATQVYTHNSLDKLKAVFDQAHPKA